MKYMGSKRLLLQNGLGEILRKNVNNYHHFVDLMCGSGMVSYHVAENYPIRVLSYDIQQFAVILTNAIINRVEPLNISLFSSIIDRVEEEIQHHDLINQWNYINQNIKNKYEMITIAREFCSATKLNSPIFNAYGGHYFSPYQAIVFDLLLDYIPAFEPEKTVFHGAIIAAASKCVASPGHTAQPFQPTPTAIDYILEAWSKDPLSEVTKELFNICPRHAIIKGQAVKKNAFTVIDALSENDLVFIDPPYSSVQYSRFYHVLETIAVNQKFSVSGKGRYPEISKRPQSTFSNTGQSKEAIETLLRRLALRHSSIIITFPKNLCSNGLSGEYIKNLGEKYFYVNYYIYPSRMSTLGGNNKNRRSRIKQDEIILTMIPR